MLWRYIEKKVKNSFYPDLYYWSPILPRAVRRSIYKKYDLNIRFEIIPEFWSPYYYYCFFGKEKGYHYPTDDDIKFFYFTLFKKNGFLFILLICILYRNCFLDLLFLLIKSGIAFYLIVSFIYLVLFIRKYVLIFRKIFYRVPIKYYPTLILFMVNYFLNIIFNSKQKWYF